MAHPTSLTWFVRHELGLAWRDWFSMMTAGKSGKQFILAGVLFAHCRHCTSHCGLDHPHPGSQRN